MGTQLFLLVTLALVVEGFTELIIKSKLFSKFRSGVSQISPFFDNLFSCGNCFSYWATALLLSGINFYKGLPLVLTDVFLLDFVFSLFIIQRISNVLHFIFDRLDKTYLDRNPKLHVVNMLNKEFDK